LTTNPGHVDPGYQGRLSFTVINMGQVNYHLKRGDRIVTVLFTRLAQHARRGYGEVPGDIDAELLERLSHDFLDVSRRAQKAAAGEESKTRRWSVAAPILVGVLAITATLLTSVLTTRDDIQELQKQNAVLEEKLTNATIQSQIDGLTTRVNQLEGEK